MNSIAYYSYQEHNDDVYPMPLEMDQFPYQFENTCHSTFEEVKKDEEVHTFSDTSYNENFQEDQSSSSSSCDTPSSPSSSPESSLSPLSSGSQTPTQKTKHIKKEYKPKSNNAPKSQKNLCQQLSPKKLKFTENEEEFLQSLENRDESLLQLKGRKLTEFLFESGITDKQRQKLIKLEIKRRRGPGYSRRHREKKKKFMKDREDEIETLKMLVESQKRRIEELEAELGRA